MKKKATINEDFLIDKYTDFVLSKGKEPDNIYQFSKENGLTEKEFYKFFTSFDSLKKNVFETFIKQTFNILEKNKEYSDFDSSNKLLSFYFTFFELITANRSIVIYMLNQDKKFGLDILSVLKSPFREYISSLNIETIDLKQQMIDNIKDKGVKEAYWGQFVFLIGFWKKDCSPSFEKTDILIEKLVTASFEIQNLKPLESIIDLGKFLFKEIKK